MYGYNGGNGQPPQMPPGQGGGSVQEMLAGLPPEIRVEVMRRMGMPGGQGGPQPMIPGQGGPPQWGGAGGGGPQPMFPPGGGAQGGPSMNFPPGQYFNPGQPQWGGENPNLPQTMMNPPRDMSNVPGHRGGLTARNAAARAAAAGGGGSQGDGGPAPSPVGPPGVGGITPDMQAYMDQAGRQMGSGRAIGDGAPGRPGGNQTPMSDDRGFGPNVGGGMDRGGDIGFGEDPNKRYGGGSGGNSIDAGRTPFIDNSKPTLSNLPAQIKQDPAAQEPAPKKKKTDNSAAAAKEALRNRRKVTGRHYNRTKGTQTPPINPPAAS